LSVIDHARLGSLLLVCASLSLASCMNVPQMSAPASVTLPAADLSAPTTMSDMQTATILDVDIYRPQQRLPACNLRSLPQAMPDPELAAALASASTYSTEAQGVGLMVLHNGAVVHRSFADGVDGSTPFASASMMKSVMGLLVGIAIEDGLIGSVDDPLGDYLAEWESDPRGDITLRQLLTMSSGLGPLGFGEFLLAEDANAMALTMQLAGEPGAQFYYNNAVSQIVGTVIDRQTRAADRGGFAQYLYDSLWCPLGNDEALLWTDETGMPRTYAGLHAGLEDWARIGELIRQNGRVGADQVVPADWIEDMAGPSAVNDQYGLQMWRAGTWTERRPYNPDNPIQIYHSAPFAADDLVYFDGFGGQRVYVVPSSGLTIVRAGQVNLEYDDALIPNLLINALE